jgi:3-methyl-2-oxobutanoate hydroxymethyltransferase
VDRAGRAIPRPRWRAATIRRTLAGPAGEIANVSAPNTASRITVIDIARMHADGERIPVLTAYDFPTAKLVDEAGIPIILVGDSLGQVMLGYETTVRVTMDEMLHHTKAVVRGAKHSLIVADMPFLSYASPEDALANAGRFLREAGAQAVKVEGGVRTSRAMEALVRAGIPVMGHIGLTPQAINSLGKTRVQGKTREAARALLHDALAVQEAGAFAVVVELVPEQLATAITARLRIPTIGIGAGPGCSGEVQVVTDLLGMSDWSPRHAKRFANLRETMLAAFGAYRDEVMAGTFPGEAQSTRMDDAVLDEVLGRSLPDRDPSTVGRGMAIEAGIPLDRDL